MPGVTWEVEDVGNAAVDRGTKGWTRTRDVWMRDAALPFDVHVEIVPFAGVRKDGTVEGFWGVRAVRLGEVCWLGTTGWGGERGRYAFAAAEEAMYVLDARLPRQGQT